jgi:hypothetical protein
MITIFRSLLILLASLWIGAMFCIGFVVAPYLFARAARGDGAVPDSGVAADLIGPLLQGANLAGQIVPALLLVGLQLLRRRGSVAWGDRWKVCPISLAVALGMGALNYWIVAPAVGRVRQDLVAKAGSLAAADRADPLYQQFSVMHSVSTLLFIVALLAGMVAIICLSNSEARRMKGQGTLAV